MGRIQGNNLLRNCKTRQDQMRYILDNMSEPNFAMIESNDCLDNSFDLAPHDTLNTAGITWRILNSQGFGNGSHDSNTQNLHGDQLLILWHRSRTIFRPI